MGLHVGSQGLAVLEPLGAQVADDVPYLGVRPKQSVSVLTCVSNPIESKVESG